MRVLFFERRIDYMIRTGLFLCCLIFCFLLIMFASPSAFAEDEPQPGDEKTLTVTYNGETVKVFTAADLEAIAEAEGNQQYFFSAYNTKPTHHIYPAGYPGFGPNYTVTYIGGPTVLGILAEAGLSDRMRADDVLAFSDSVNYTGTITYSQLTEPRFFYPNGKKNTENGAFDDGASAENKVQVPAVIDLIDDEPYSKLFIGQKYSNEQTTPVHVDGVANGGYIKIKNNAENWDKAILKDRVVQGMLPVGIKLHFDTSVISVSGKYDAKIYYTTDGSEPDQTSTMYNYVANRWFLPAAEDSNRNFPDTSNPGHLTLKTKIIGLGKNDGPVTTFELDLVSQEEYDQAVAEEDKLIDIKGCKATLSTTSFVYSGSANKPAVTVKNETKLLTKGTDYTVSYTNNKNIGTGKATIKGIGKYTGTISRTFKIIPAKSSIYKTYRYKRAITVKYRKKAGNVRYKVAIKQAGKSWKTYNNGTRLSKKFTKLRSKKNYYIKVRAFKTVNGKPYYGSWSTTVRVRTK